MAAAVGHELGCRIYPIDGLAVRDAGQLRMAGLLAATLHPAWRAALEVPVGTGPNERRAIDQVLDHPAELVAVEIERWIVDFQAQLRSGHLKRDALAAISDRPVRFLLVLRDAPQARRALRAHAPLIARSFPIPPREAWRALRSGQPIGGDGLLLLRERELRSVPA